MDDQAYERLLRSIEDIYRERIREAERDYSRKLEALKTMRELISQSQSIRTAELTSHIQEIMPDLPEFFTAREVATILRTEFPRLNGLIKDRSVADAIKMLVQNKKVRVVEQGAGRRPATYENVRSVAMTV